LLELRSGAGAGGHFDRTSIKYGGVIYMKR
jgi:hypothetical protein